jgi:LysM repeat protein
MQPGSILQVDPPGPELRFHWNPSEFVRQAGVGGWREVSHPRQKATTEWEGTPLHRVSLPLVFSALRRRSSMAPEWASRALDARRGTPDIEDELNRLHRYGLPDGSEPPRLRITYGPGQQILWVVQELEWRKVLFDPRTGRRVYAEVTVELLEHRAASVISSPIVRAQPAQPGAAASGRVYTVRPGDTLSGIAQRELGAASRWTEIADLNGIPRGAERNIQPGQQLRLPA